MQQQAYENDRERIGGELSHERARTEQIAQQLGQEAMSQWTKAITGLIALPTAIALGTATWALYVASFVERGFEVFQQRAVGMNGRVRGGESLRSEGGGRRTVRYDDIAERHGGDQPRA